MKDIFGTEILPGDIVLRLMSCSQAYIVVRITPKAVIFLDRKSKWDRKTSQYNVSIKEVRNGHPDLINLTAIDKERAISQEIMDYYNENYKKENKSIF